jgi:hypothetical protein
MKTITARFFMLLASVLILKVCFAAPLFNNTPQASNKTSIDAANSFQHVLLNITDNELEEDENEETNNTKFFTELHYLSTLIHQIKFEKNSSSNAHSCQYLPEQTPIFKQVNCFRI